LYGDAKTSCFFGRWVAPYDDCEEECEEECEEDKEEEANEEATEEAIGEGGGAWYGFRGDEPDEKSKDLFWFSW
jgi:hypothetical protein